MPPIEYHLLPPVKRAVAVLATTMRYSLATCAALALAEMVLLPLHLPMAAILSGLISSFLLPLSIAMLAVLAAWCHAVLLAGQGILLSRWLTRVGAGLAPLVPICWGYSYLTGRLLLYRQAELPLILGSLLLGTALFNIPKMAAAPWQLQVRVVALPLLLLAAYCFDVPGGLVFCSVAKVLAAWVAATPLRLLSSFAPRIISMPEKD
jgi:hypothetical protein